jgi:hypothetical protein
MRPLKIVHVGEITGCRRRIPARHGLVDALLSRRPLIGASTQCNILPVTSDAQPAFAYCLDLALPQLRDRWASFQRKKYPPLPYNRNSDYKFSDFNIHCPSARYQN